MSDIPSKDISTNTEVLTNVASEEKSLNKIDSDSSTLEDAQSGVKLHYGNTSTAKDNAGAQDVKDSVLFPSISHEEALDDSYSSTIDATEPFAQGLIKFLTPVIQEMDGQIDSVKSSQSELQRVIEKLLNELQLFVDTNHPPYILPSVQKLVNARKRLATVNTTLKLVQERLDRLLTQIE